MDNTTNNSIKMKQKSMLIVFMICIAIMLVISFSIDFHKIWIAIVVRSIITSILVLLCIFLSKKTQQETIDNHNHALKAIMDKMKELQTSLSNNNDTLVQRLEFLSTETENKLSSTRDNLSTLFINYNKQLMEKSISNTSSIVMSIEEISYKLSEEFKRKSEQYTIQLSKTNEIIAQQSEETKKIILRTLEEYKAKLETMNNSFTSLLVEEQKKQMNEIKSNNAQISSSLANLSQTMSETLSKQDTQIKEVLMECEQFEKIRLEISNLSQLIKIINLSKEDASKEAIKPNWTETKNKPNKIETKREDVVKEAKKPNRTETIEDSANNLRIKNLYENNKLVKSEMLKGGRITYIVSYNADGKMKGSTSYDDHGVIIMETSYYPNGQIKQRIEYKNGKKFAVSDFNENGEKK